MALLETLRKDMFEARKAGDVNKANIISIAVASITNFKIEVQRDITDEDVLTILRKEEKKLREAFEQYSNNGRDDLAKIEKEQLEVIQTYLPKLLSEKEVEKFVKAEVKKIGEVSPRDIGRVMGQVMGKLKGKADGTVVNNIVRKVLGA